KYFENNDDTSASQTTQSFYGIWDKNLASLTSFDRDDLLQQEILEEINLDGDEDDDYRITSDNPIDWSTNMGWYIDLINTEGGNTDNKGERQISASILRDGRIIFTTMMPEDNPCSAGGTGWLMELDARDGSRLAFSPFDINDDNAFDEDDYIQATVDVNGDGTVDENDKVPPSGTKSEVGIIPMPAILSGEEEYKYTPGTTGDIQTTTENPGPGSTGRQSWRELDF
ncbi:MAG: fimbrial assembly protein, partial [Chromatiales bacterium]